MIFTIRQPFSPVLRIIPDFMIPVNPKITGIHPKLELRAMSTYIPNIIPKPLLIHAIHFLRFFIEKR